MSPTRSTLLGLGLLSLGLLTSCATRGPASRPAELTTREREAQVGYASYYARAHDGRRTASGERYDMDAMTAAHRTLPFGTSVRVTNLQNGREAVLRVNDRGPFRKGRVIDVSYAAARKLGLVRSGVAKVRVEVLRDPFAAE